VTSRRYLLACLLIVLPASTVLMPSVGVNNFSRWWRFLYLEHIWFDIDRIMLDMEELIPANATVLTFRQADFAFYTHRRHIDHNDPRMMNIYRMRRVPNAHRALITMGIEYVVLPPYSPPTFYNTTMATLLADPQRSRLLYSDRGYRLLQLRPPDQPAPASEFPVQAVRIHAPPLINTRPAELLQDLPARVLSMAERPFRTSPERPTLEVREDKVDLVQPDRWRLMIYSGPNTKVLEYPHLIKADRPYRFSVEARGRGRVTIYLYAFAFHPELGEDEQIAGEFIYDGLLSSQWQTVGGLLRTNPQSQKYRLFVVHHGRGYMSLRNLRLQELDVRPLPNEAALIDDSLARTPGNR